MKTIGTIRIVLVTILVSAICSTALADLRTAAYPTALPAAIVAPQLGPLPINGGPWYPTYSYYMYDFVDIGKLGSEAGHAMNSWGPIQPLTSGGNWGGGEDCRVIWDPLTGSRSATISVDFGPQVGPNKYLALRWLDGQAWVTGGTDSFDIWLGGVGGQFIGSVLNGTAAQELWYDMGVWNCGPLVGVVPVTLNATGPMWGSFGTYGQVGFSQAATFTVPAPGAALLGVIGLSAIAWIRRRVS